MRKDTKADSSNFYVVGMPKKVEGVKIQEVQIVYNFAGELYNILLHLCEKGIFSGIL